MSPLDLDGGKEEKSSYSEKKTFSNLQCGECKKMYSTPGVLKKHKRSVHEGILYPCRLCDRKFTQTGHLKIHISRVHGKD